MLKEQIEQKKNLIQSKRQKIIESSSNLAKIDKIASEKQVDAKYHQEVFKAFKTKLSDDQKTSGQNL